MALGETGLLWWQAAKAALTQEVQEVCLHHHEKRGINEIFHDISLFANHNHQSHCICMIVVYYVNYVYLNIFLRVKQENANNCENYSEFR